MILRLHGAVRRLRHWWIHSIWAALLFPTSRKLWRERLKLDDGHAEEMAAIAESRRKLEAEVRDWLEDNGITRAAMKAKEARRHV